MKIPNKLGTNHIVTTSVGKGKIIRTKHGLARVLLNGKVYSAKLVNLTHVKDKSKSPTDVSKLGEVKRSPYGFHPERRSNFQ